MSLRYSWGIFWNSKRQRRFNAFKEFVIEWSDWRINCDLKFNWLCNFRVAHSQMRILNRSFNQMSFPHAPNELLTVIEIIASKIFVFKFSRFANHFDCAFYSKIFSSKALKRKELFSFLWRSTVGSQQLWWHTRQDVSI